MAAENGSVNPRSQPLSRLRHILVLENIYTRNLRLKTAGIYLFRDRLPGSGLVAFRTARSTLKLQKSRLETVSDGLRPRPVASDSSGIVHNNPMFL